MEGKQQVSLGDGLATVDSHGQELRVVDFSIVVKVHTGENLVDLFLRNV